jgi:predicted PurR-regulated permease PerM
VNDEIGTISWVRHRTLLFPALLVGLGALAFLMWTVRVELMVLFGGILFGAGVYRLAAWLSERTGIPPRLATALWCLAALLTVGAFLVFAGQRVAEQYGEFGARFPEALQSVEDRMRGVPLLASLRGRVAEIRAEMTDTGEGASGDGDGAGSTSSETNDADSDSMGMGLVQLTFRTVSLAIVWAIIVFFSAADGRRYFMALLRLFPPERRRVGEDLLQALASALPWWLVGRAAAMGVVSVLTFAGLMFLDVPLALVLAVIAGLCSFVPLIGPAASVVPAVVIALEAAPSKVIWVLALYGGVQLVESNLISPWIQKRVASVPPLLMVSAQLLMGTLVGLAGIMFSTPLALAVMVTIQVVYMRHTLGEEVTTPREEAA